MRVLIKDARLVVTQNAEREVLRNTSLYIEDGVIKALGSREELEGLGADLEIDARSLAVMPGLINLHTHSTQTVARGLYDHLPLMSWLYHMDRLYEHVDDYAAKAAARLAFIEGLLCGTTTFLDMELQASPVIEAAREVGVRLFEAVALADTRETGLSGFERIADPDELVKNALSMAQRLNGDKLVRVALGPVGFPSSSPELLRLATDEARRSGLLVHTHLSESMVNERLARKLFGLGETLLLEKQGVLGPWLTVAHAVNVSTLDIDTLAKHGVSVAHCPSSNAKLGNGVAPAWRMMSRGVNVGLGTDGAASNNSMDVFQEMKTFVLMQRALERQAVVTAQEALDAATVNAARALGMRGVIGSIEVGARADIVLVDLESVSMHPTLRLLENIVFSGGCRSVRHVLVEGRLLVDNGKLVDGELAARALAEFDESFGRVAQNGI